MPTTVIGPIVQNQLAAHNPSVAAETALPVLIAQHRYRVRAGDSIIRLAEKPSPPRLHA